MITIKKYNLHQMLQDMMEEFLQRGQGGIPLASAMPQGDAQGSSDDDDDDGRRRVDGVQFAGSPQTTPGEYDDPRIIPFGIPCPISPVSLLPISPYLPLLSYALPLVHVLSLALYTFHITSLSVSAYVAALKPALTC
jgi:hypothetical protein